MRFIQFVCNLVDIPKTIADKRMQFNAEIKTLREQTSNVINHGTDFSVKKCNIIFA